MSDAKTAAALKHLVQKRMDALDSVQEDGDQLFANEVESHAPDEDGRNWDMHGYRGARGYATEVRVLVDRLRRQYRLVPFDADSRYVPEQWSSQRVEGYDGPDVAR